MSLDIKPAAGMLAIRLVDGDVDDDSGVEGTSDEYNKALYAIVVGVGPKVTGVKRGQTILVRAYAKDGVKIDDETVLVDSYCFLGTVQ